MSFDITCLTGGNPINHDKHSEMEALDRKLKAGEIDENIVDILSLINSSEDYYTKSSCSGRIQLIALPKLGDKPGSEVIEKWHEPVEFSELISALKNWNGEHTLMLLVQSPVIHIACRDLAAAVRIRNIGNESGFKYSTIRSLQAADKDDEGRMNIVVEILSTERLDIPLGKDGVLHPDDKYLEFIHDLALAALERSNAKLKRLEENLRKLTD